MHLPRPRTLLSMILTGLGLLTLPLLVGIGNAVLTLDRLTSESEAVVSASADSTLANQRIVRAIANMERNARQFILLQDPELLDLYAKSDATLVESLNALAELPQDTAIAADYAEVRSLAEGLRTMLAPPAADIDSDRLVADLRQMADAGSAAADSMRSLVNQRLTDLQENASGAQRTLFWQAAALIPGTLLLVLFFLLLIGRPMRQVDRAIRELGEGRYDEPIAVSGPADLETLGTRLEWLRDRLMESTEEKNRFLRHMSHELKTPLANIREGTELLLDGSVGELGKPQQEVTVILRDNGLRLQQLIENLLTFSAWQSNTAAIELSRFELKPLVFAVLSQHRLAIASRRIKLQIDAHPVEVTADQGKIRLVLENLVSNALKFTPDQGAIYVHAAMDGDTLVIEVADTGPGIAAEDRPRIFEAFYQGRRLQGGPVGGTGIGLSVVLECVQAHGGDVRILDESRFTGAHFMVRLPLRRRSDRLALVANG